MNVKVIKIKEFYRKEATGVLCVCLTKIRKLCQPKFKLLMTSKYSELSALPKHLKMKDKACN